MGIFHSLPCIPGLRPIGNQYNGLKNQGATCYLNTVLQCLYMTEEFRKAVESYRQDLEDSEQKSDALMQELQKLFEKLESSVGTTEGITRCLGIRNVHEQQDAVEYYQKIIKVIGPRASRIFEGVISNNSKCLHDHLYQERSNFITIPLSIDVGQNEVYKVEKGLETFFKTIKFDEDNWLYCQECEKKMESENWNEIEAFPTVLTLYLKRFEFDYRQMSLVKNDCPMDIPYQLHMKNGEYDLYAVINHRGGRSGGHYNALIKSSVNAEWYCFDDTSVTKSSLNSLHQFCSAWQLCKGLSCRLSGKEAKVNIFHDKKVCIIGYDISELHMCEGNTDVEVYVEILEKHILSSRQRLCSAHGWPSYSCTRKQKIQAE